MALFSAQIEGAQQPLGASGTLEHQQRRRHIVEADAAADQRRMALAPGEKAAGEGQHRVRVGFLRATASGGWRGSTGSHGSSRREKPAFGPSARHGIGVRAPSRPRWRGQKAMPSGSTQPLERHLGLRQAQFLALVEEDRPAQAAEQRDQQLRERRLRFVGAGRRAQRDGARTTSWLEKAHDGQAVADRCVIASSASRTTSAPNASLSNTKL